MGGPQTEKKGIFGILLRVGGVSPVLRGGITGGQMEVPGGKFGGLPGTNFVARCKPRLTPA